MKSTGYEGVAVRAQPSGNDTGNDTDGYQEQPRPPPCPGKTPPGARRAGGLPGRGAGCGRVGGNLTMGGFCAQSAHTGLAAALDLPFPPVSGNHGVRHAGGSHYLNPKTGAYRAAVAAEVAALGLHRLRLTGPLRMHLVIHPPDRRRRDLDNLMKQLGDALVAAGVLADDSMGVIQAGGWEVMAPESPGMISVRLSWA